MFQLISIALFALAGLSSVSNAAPTGNSLMNPTTPIANAAVGMKTIPINWKRDHQLDHQSIDTTILTEEFIKTAIAQAMSHQVKMAKRDDDTFDLSTVFRGVFDKLIDYIIEVTPLNDIVHGNYDLLYKIFLEKVDELVAGIAAGAQPGAAPSTFTNPLTAGSTASGSDTAKESTDKKGHKHDEDYDDEDNDEDGEDREDNDVEYDEDNDEDGE